MLNSGEFYGQPEPTLNLQLLKRFYDAHPEYVDKTYLSVKGGLGFKDGAIDFTPNASEENLRRSVANINEILGGKKKMDMFEMARVDQKIPIEDAMRTLLKLRDEGHFKDIALSESAADTIRRAAKVAPIAGVEVECVSSSTSLRKLSDRHHRRYSPWSLNIEHNGVIDACKELNIPIIAYSPLGKGFLTGSLKSPDDIPEGDHRKHFERFQVGLPSYALEETRLIFITLLAVLQPGNFEKNLELVDKLVAIAKNKGITPAQLALAWEIQQCDLIYPIPGSTRVEGVNEALGALKVALSKEELDEIRKIVDNADVIGGRYRGKGDDVFG